MTSPADDFVEQIADRVIGKASPKLIEIIEEAKKIFAGHDTNAVSSNPVNLSAIPAPTIVAVPESVAYNFKCRLTPFGHIKV